MKNLMFNVANYLLAPNRDTRFDTADGGSGGSGGSSGGSQYSTAGTAKTLSEAAEKFGKVIKNIVAPIIMVIGVVAAIYAIYLGVMYAKADSAEKRKEVQGRLIGACIGALIIIVGATLCFAINFASIYDSFSKSV